MNEYAVKWSRGKGPGGQNKNKTENCCTLTHVPTGVSVRVDERDRATSLRNAKRLMAAKLTAYRERKKAERKTADRKLKIEPGGVPRIRTYDYTKGVVIDHRTGQTASIKDVVGKGRLDKLRCRKAESGSA